MNKQELIDAVAAQAGASKGATEETVNAVLAAISKEVAGGKPVQLIGFGTFSSSERAVRTGRNPSTGATIQIAAAKTVKFTAGKSFKDVVNQRLDFVACSQDRGFCRVLDCVGGS